jgi:aspartyl-tRNA(Asn)/glutamyl-tRNA(Gln) amidotransferase subunit C
MSLSHDDVRKIAHLARLAVSDADVDAYARNLTSILDFVEQMESVDTDHVTPMAHPQDTAQRLRDDVVSEADQRERFQAIAPAVDAGLYLVPRVIE